MHLTSRLPCQAWLAWPANVFDTPYLAWDTEKTDAPVTIPWSVLPELRERIEAAKLRRQDVSRERLKR